ncbi:MAG: VanZ family protein [Bacteroidota bacterium]
MKPYWPAVLCAVFIFYLSVTPGIQLPEVGISIDKIGHLVAYGLLSWLFFWGLKKDSRYNFKNAIWTVLVCSLYGIFLEFVQWGFFPDRFFEVWDMVANVSGSCMSYFIFRLFINKT